MKLSDKAKDFLIEKGYDKKYGARPLKRVLQNQIEDKLAEHILSGDINRGDNVRVDCKGEDDDKELTFKAQVKRVRTKELISN